MEIPTAVIHRLQSSLRGAAGAALDAAPAPPFPSVADAVAAFDAGSPASASTELRCGRCGAVGGFLRGARSAVCAYCGSPRRGEGGGCEGGGVAFRDGPAYRWLLGSLGLDGSELVEFDDENSGSNKSKEAPKNGIIISDLLDLKLTRLPENKETPASSISEEQPSVAHTPNLSGVNVDSFFIERKEVTPAAAVLPQTRTVVQEKKTTDSKSLESSRSDTHAASTGAITSSRTNQTEDAPAFASWDAEFQSACSVSAAGDSEQLDLFKGSSATESFSFPSSVTAINPVVGAGNKTDMKNATPEYSEGLTSMDNKLVTDNLFSQKVVQPILESSSGISPENSVPDFVESSLNNKSLKGDELRQRDDTRVSDDDLFDDWQEFTGGEDQVSLSNAGESKEEPLKRDSSKMNAIDPWPLGSMESPNNVNGDSSNDWQAFGSSSAQGVEDWVKPMEGSTSGQDGLVRLVEETISNTSFEHPSQDTGVDLWPMGNVDTHRNTEMVKETSDSFDDWQDFTTSGQVQNTLFSQTGDMMEVVTVSQKEMDLDSWFMGDSREAKKTDLVNGKSAMLNDWQGFTGSDQLQQNTKNHSLEHHEEVDGSNKDAVNTSSTSMDSDGFDIWQDFAKSGQATIVPPEPTKEIDAMNLWVTSNFKESNNKDVRKTYDSSDGWQDFASFGQEEKSTKIPEEGPKDPLGIETLNLWASSNAAEKKLEQGSGNNDLFDDWQDFKNSGETSLQAFSDASSLDRPLASKPNAVVGLELGTISGLASSQNQNVENEAVPFDEHSKSMNVMQQLKDVDSLSAIWAIKDAISEPEPADPNVGKLLSQMHDLSFMLKDELSVPDKSVDHSKS